MSLRGKVFGTLTVVRDLRPDDAGNTGKVWVSCSCGRERFEAVSRLASGEAGCRWCARATVGPQEDQPGCCRRCGQPSGERRHCKDCLEKFRTKYREARPELSARHCCAGCGQPGHDTRTCPLPVDVRMATPSNTERSRTVRDRRIVAGLCTGCGKEPRKEGRLHGEICLKRHLDYHYARKERTA